MSTSNDGHKVCVIGAAGGIGQPLSLLLKLDENVSDLSLYDVAPVTPGVGADLSHIATRAEVTADTGDDGMARAMEGADVVVVPAGVPRKPGMTRDDLFNINASIVANIAKTMAKTSPDAMLLIISNPVNSTVPVAAQTLQQLGLYNPNRVAGVTYLDVLRATTFVNPHYPGAVPTVIGGHAGTTIIPLLSQVGHFSDEDRDALTHRIQFGGDEVVKAKAGGGSATLSMAYAGYVFTKMVIAGLNGQETTVPAYVDTANVASPPCEGVRFFASPVTFGTEGVKEVHGFGAINEYEQGLINNARADLINQANKGLSWAKDNA
jgi:malate dehydrogenase